MILQLKRPLRKLLRLLGVEAYCKLAFNGLDDKLARHLDFKNGVFLEAGANDGLAQSNSYYLERIKGWRGILVEPVPSLFEACRRARPRAICVNAALVPGDYSETTVQLQTAGLMTMVAASSGNTHYSSGHIEKGLAHEGLRESQSVEAEAKTLDEVIRTSGFEKIDFMSLDLEGYEVEALRGLSLERYGPDWMLLEVRDRAAVEALIGEYYREVETLTRNERYCDVLYRKK